MVTITLKGREIPLLFTTLEMKTIQEEVGVNFGDVAKLIYGKNPDVGFDIEKSDEENDKAADIFGSSRHMDALGKTVMVLGNAGLEESGKDPDLTVKKVLRMIRPVEIREVINKVLDAMLNDGMKSEIPPKNENEPVDVTLEEINRKKEETN